MKHDGKSVTDLFSITSETLFSLSLIWLLDNDNDNNLKKE